MKKYKIVLIIFTLLFLTSCNRLELNPEWYPHGLWKDDIFVSRPNGKFNIGQYGNVQSLIVYTESGDSDGLLSHVTDHKRIDNEVYVYSDEGYCIIDEKNNTAKVLVTAEEDFDLRTNDPAVTYLKSFDEFSNDAQKIFKEMADFWEDKEYRRYGSSGKIYPDGTVEYN